MNPLLKYRLKKALNNFRISLRPGSEGRRELLDSLKQLRRVGFYPATVIDVGVADGTFELYDTFPEARHILVESLMEFETALKFICRRYNAEYVVCAASDSDGSCAIHFSTDLHGASLLQEKGMEGRIGVQSRRVPCARLDTLAAHFNTTGPYLIKVDVQGYELEVLEGAIALLPEVEVAILETSMFQFKESGVVFDQVISYMKRHRFVAYDIVGALTRPLDNALAQLDIVFVKQHGHFRRCDLFATATQRAAWERRLTTRVRRRMKV